jgi:hypothetical protein
MTTTDFTDPYGSTWRQDPASGQWSRWDGTQWTTTGKVPPGFGQPPPPMAGYRAAGPPRRRRRVWPWVLGSIGLVIVLVIVLFVVAVGKAVHDLDAEQRSHAISQRQFEAVKLGTSQADVEAQLGKSPQNAQTFVTKKILSSGQISSSCLYYNETGHFFGTYYQFCFSTGSLFTKHSF